VRIPLDYYRILGLPLAASDEQLQVAYRDRSVQLPRREYSEAAIAARKKLIEEAYTVLSDPEKRSTYDERYLAQSYEDGITSAKATGGRPESDKEAIEPQTPSIEIADELFVGALLLLQELGEYELVLKLGRPYLTSRPNSKTAKMMAKMESEQLGEFSIERADIVLTVALACLELGREQWQQGQYENAAMSLETGQELLLREGQFVGVRGEIQGDLYKLRPYRILELLSLPEENVAERRQGMELLQSILQERGGIDGTGDDQSGLNIDDFLRFIQQLRSYLTSEEQQKLFETESKRPSAVATYLAVYALLARGFAQRQPGLIRQAKHMLIPLGKRQDVHLEQAVCALLLGQTEEASRALELSQEYEPLAFIRENSQGAPDLLPGLCLYGERWLQNEVFPHFRDLAQAPASLKDYFADPQVQAYLEELPSDAEASSEWTVMPQESISFARDPISRRSSTLGSDSSGRYRSFGEQNGRQNHTPLRGGYANFSATTSAAERITNLDDNSTPPDEEPVASNDASVRDAYRDSYQETYPSTYQSTYQSTSSSSNVTTTSAARQAAKSRRRTRSQSSRSSKDWATVGQGSTAAIRAFGNSMDSKTRIVWLVFGGLVGLVILWLLASAAYGWVREVFFPTPVLKGEQLQVQLNQPPVPIPDSKAKMLAPAGPLNEETAEDVIMAWLSSKSAALGSNHNTASLEDILVDPALSQWRQVAEQDKQNSRHRVFKHSVKIASVVTSNEDPDKAEVEATVNEVAEVYDNGQKNQDRSYDENVRVKYHLVRQDGMWRIREMARQ
jgi:hypothetical protein